MKNRRIHPAWIVLVGLILIQGGFIGVAINCLSVLFAGVAENMGFATSKLSLFYTIRGLLSGFLVAPTVAFFMKKKDPRLIAGMGALVGISFCMMSVYQNVWNWYISAVLNAIGACMGPMMVPMIINAWFVKKRGFATGIAMAASGVAGAVFSPICGSIIQSTGWRMASVVMGITVMALTMIPGFFIVKITPEQAGCKPYGVDEGEEDGAGKKNARLIEKDYPLSVFLMMGFSMLVFTMLTQFAFLMPTYARVLGYATMVGATLTSVSMVGNIGGKLVFGVAVDKFGVHKTTIATLVLGALSFTLLMFGKESSLFLYCGAFLFGSLYSLGTVAASLLCMDSFGKNYQKPMSKITAVTQIAAAFATPFYSFVYELSGAFTPVLIGCAISCLLPTAVLLILEKKS